MAGVCLQLLVFSHFLLEEAEHRLTPVEDDPRFPGKLFRIPVLVVQVQEESPFQERAPGLEPLRHEVLLAAAIQGQGNALGVGEAHDDLSTEAGVAGNLGKVLVADNEISASERFEMFPDPVLVRTLVLNFTTLKWDDGNVLWHGALQSLRDYRALFLAILKKEDRSFSLHAFV